MHATIESYRVLQKPEQEVTAAGLPPEPASWGRQRRGATSVTLLVWTVRLCAVLNLLAFSQRHMPPLIYRLADWVPFEISVGRRVLMLMTAVLLFILSSGLERGKRLAWIVTISALAFTPFIHLGRTIIWPQVLLNAPLLVLLLANRRYFVARSSRQSVRSALIISPCLVAALMIFGTVRLHTLRFETSGPDSWLGCLQAACELVLVQNAQTQHAQTHQTLILFSELRIAGTSIALLTLFLALRPALRPRAASVEEQVRVARLLQQYGHDPLHAYSLLGDKYFFFHATEDSALSYVLSSRFAITLGGPLGPEHAHPETVRQFAEYCRQQDWVPLFYEVEEHTLSIFRSLGMPCLQIGEDARLDMPRFTLTGGAFQNLRTLGNKARREGLRFGWFDEQHPPDAGLIQQLAMISNAWLRQKNGNEMTFDMGSFSREEIARACMGVAFDERGLPLAFTTWRHFARGKGMVLDLMRSSPGARNVLDFIMVESIRHAQSVGVTDVSLGNAPLANAAGKHTPRSVEDRVVRFIYENLNYVFAYKPLFEFKRKYRPQWRARFLAYPAGESLPLIGLALVHVHTRRGPWSFFAR